MAIVAIFVLGYACIALEGVIKVNKAGIALLMMVLCWMIVLMAPGNYFPNVADANLLDVVSDAIEKQLGSTGTTLFFLMGAMTIVEIVDQNGGFNFVQHALHTTSKRRLMWYIVLMTFALSTILDNLTTSIVMVMVLRKLVEDRQDRMILAALVVIAANSGGAFSPIGDVTTIMLWNQGMVSPSGIIIKLFIPALLSLVVPVLLLQRLLKGNLQPIEIEASQQNEDGLTKRQRKLIFFLGVGGLILVPVIRSLTGLPPFMGILLILSLLWITTEVFYAHLKNQPEGGMSKRVSNLIRHIDMTTILFFLGILMAVGCLEQVGVLSSLGTWLNGASGGNHYLVTGAIGLVSSIVDNVPLVAGCMGMYPIAPMGDMAVDGVFWHLLAYCAGVGGSILIVGSAAGVVVMGLEKINFGWHMRNISWAALLGYFAGMAFYWLENAIF